jgi:hypothetical protein
VLHIGVHDRPRPQVERLHQGIGIATPAERFELAVPDPLEPIELVAPPPVQTPTGVQVEAVTRKVCPARDPLVVRHV